MRLLLNMGEREFHSIEDLITDESFVAWYKRTDPHSVEKWDHWVAANAKNAKLAAKAIEVLNAMIVKEAGPSTSQADKSASALMDKINNLDDNEEKRSA
ncbi:MAG TPA: hypothetical protein VFV08_13500 [Puia sp.]|nr:hypothetical protein [Puia sp.]